MCDFASIVCQNNKLCMEMQAELRQMKQKENGLEG